jgi:hypothetical protein
MLMLMFSDIMQEKFFNFSGFLLFDPGLLLRWTVVLLMPVLIASNLTHDEFFSMKIQDKGSLSSLIQIDLPTHC